jgi:ATP-binding cassette subfamily B protein
MNEPNERRSLREQVGSTGRVLARTLALVGRAAPSGTAAVAVLTGLGALLPVAVALAGKALVDAVVARHRPQAVRWLLVECGLVTVQVVLGRALSACQQILGERLRTVILGRVLEKAASVPMSRFEDGEFYDQLTRVRQESSFRPLSVVTETFRSIQAAITLGSYLALLLPYSRGATALLLGAVLPAAFVDVWFSRSRFLMRYWQSPEGRRLSYLEHMMTSDASVKEVKLLDLAGLLLGRYRATSDRILRQSRSLMRRQALWATAVFGLGAAAFYVCYLGIVVAAVSGAITLGAMTLYLVAFRQSQQEFQSLLSAFGTVYEDTLYMSNLFGYLAIDDKPAPRRLATVRAERGLRLDGVGFRYPRKEAGAGDDAPWVLRDLSVFVPPAQSVAVVGANGAGKTTLIKLMLGLHQPTEGAVLLDGRDLRDWDGPDLRRRFAVVFQDFAGFEFELRENVGFGSVEHLHDGARIRRAAIQGGVDSFAGELPDGLATKLGKWAHDGVQVSRGQWQQIALARAFMREEADILVLDEPTASLDAHAEAAMFHRFHDLRAGRTSFVISHRLSALQTVERILVLEGGRLVEDGSHGKLLAAGSTYARMYRRQSAGYGLDRECGG